MNIPVVRKRLSLAAVGLFLLIGIGFNLLPRTDAESNAALAPSITATKATVFLAGAGGDVDGDGQADPGDTITYTVTVNNTAAPGAGNDATGVIITDTLSNLTTLVGGSVNAQPLVGNDAFNVTGNVGISVPDGASDLLANDIDPDTGSGAALTMVTTTATSTNCVVASCPANNVVINANGSFTYNPPPGYEGSDTFTYTVRDNGPDGIGGNADDATATGTVTLTISGMVWFINSGAAVACTTQAAGCGRLLNPFSTLAAFQGLNNGGAGSVNPAINDNIFIYEAATAYTGGVTLLNGQKLIGQDSTSNLATITGITLPSFSNPFPAMNTVGNATTIQNAGGNAVTLNNVAGSNILNGFTASNSSNFAILGTGFGTVTVDNVIINTNTAGLSLTTGAFAGSGFSSFTSQAGTNNLTLTTVTGSMTITGGLMSGATGIGFNVSGGTVAISNGAAISYTGANAAVSISGGHTTGTITFAGVNATNGTGLQFDNADGTYTFNGSNTMNGGDAGIDILNGSTGTFSFSSTTTITRANGVAGAAFNLSGATAANANVTYSGSMTLGTGTGNMVNIDNHDSGTITFQTGNLTKGSSTTQGISISNSNGGTINFNNPTIGITMTSGNAISLTTNTGGTMNFAPAAGGNGIDVTTTSGIGLNATGGGTVVVTGSGNTIASTTGTALNVNATTIGASGLTFQSIASNGAPSGIILNNTGAGGLTVTGNTAGVCGGNFTQATNAAGTATAAVSGDCSGGRIQASTASGILLTNASNVSLTRMWISGSLDDGIGGTTVSNLNLTACLLESNGNAVGDRGIDITNLTGSGGISASTIRGSKEHNVIITNNTTPTPLTAFNITNCQIATNDLTPVTGTGDDGIQILKTGTGSMSVSVTQCGFTDNKGDHFQAATDGAAATTGSITAVFSNNTLRTTAANDPQVVGGGITINPGGGGDILFTVANNNINEAFDDTINLNHDPSSTGVSNLEGTVNNNIIGTAGTAASGSESSNTVTVAAKGAGSTTIAVTNNTIREWGNQYGIFLGNTEGTGTSNYTVTGNTLTTTFPNALLINAIRVDAGATAGPPNDTGTLCAGITGNNVTGMGNAANGDADIRLRQRFGTTIRLPGYGGANNDSAAVNAFVSANNDPNGGAPPAAPTVSSAFNVPGGGGFVGGAACTTPAFAPFAEEVGLVVSGNWDDLAFLDTPSKLPIFDAELMIESEVSTPLAEVEMAKAELDDASLEVQTTTVSEAEGELIIEEEPSAVGVLLTRLGEMISPTAYAQKEAPARGGGRLAPEAGETVCIDADALATCAGPGFALPAGKSVVVTFKATVNNGPFLSGVNNITNTASVSAAGPINVNSNTTSLVLDAAPDLQVTVSDGGTTTQPGAVIQYTTTYQNNTAVNGQDAAAVRVTQTVPINTTFNATVSGAGWSCPNGSAAGTACTFDVGPVNAGAAPAALNFAVNVLPLLPAGAVNIGDTATIAENPLNANGNDRVPANNSSSDLTNIIGNWDGSNSADWALPQNWSNDVLPPPGNSISIPLAGNQPQVISADVSVNLLSLGRNLSIGSGRTVSASGNVALGANIVDGLGTLSVGTASAITRTSGQVNATLRKNFSAGPLPAFEMPVGTTGEYSPLFVTVTSGSGQLTARATATLQPVLTPNANDTLERFWTLSGSGIISNITFQYLNADIPVTANEAGWNIIRVTGTTAIRYPPTLPYVAMDPANNRFTINDLASYSDWTAGAPLAPTAANANVSGRVLDTTGRGVYGAQVSLTDQAGNVSYATTNPFGYYRFLGVPGGQTYLIQPTHKRHRFQGRTIALSEDVAEFDFTAEP